MYVANRKYKIDDKWYEIGYFKCHYKHKYKNKSGYTIKVVDRRCSDDTYNTAVITPYDKIYNLKGIKPEWAVAPNFDVFVTANNKLTFLSYFTLYFGRIERTREEFNFHLENSIKLLKAFNLKGNCTNTFFKARGYHDNLQINLAVMVLSIEKGSARYYRTTVLDPAILIWELSNPENYQVDDRLHKELSNILDNILISLPIKTYATLEYPDRLYIRFKSLNTESKIGVKEIRCCYNLSYRMISEVFLEQQD
jgi:hypothetical protein